MQSVWNLYFLVQSFLFQAKSFIFVKKALQNTKHNRMCHFSNLNNWKLAVCMLLWCIYSNLSSAINIFSAYWVYLDDLVLAFWQLSFAVLEYFNTNEHTFHFTKGTWVVQGSLSDACPFLSTTLSESKCLFCKNSPIDIEHDRVCNFKIWIIETGYYVIWNWLL